MQKQKTKNKKLLQANKPENNSNQTNRQKNVKYLFFRYLLGTDNVWERHSLGTEKIDDGWD